MAKCPKCENDNFKIEKREDELYCYVVCSKCNTLVGVLEDIDFKKKLNLITNNQCGIDRLINEKYSNMEYASKKQFDELNNKLEEIYSLLYKNCRYK